MTFRLLRADEIDCRVAMITESGLSLLLYKDARVDQNILDETVGAMNWQRKHTRDNANCIVSIWDEDKKQWIEKEDTGTESFTEKEKGLASDSFKRACFNWGIGRELYSAPFIWIKEENTRIVKENVKLKCKDSFYVEQILYDDHRNIVALSIKSTSTNKRVFVMDGRPKQSDSQKECKAEEMAEDNQKKIENSKISDVKIRALLARCKKEGVDSQKICALYKVESFADLTERKYSDINLHWQEIKDM